MFEQATLPDGPAGKRAWTTLIGVSSQLAVITVAIVLPMARPEILPLAKLETLFAPPLPLPPAPHPLDGQPQHHPGHVSVVRELFPSPIRYAPTKVPDRIPVSDDIPDIP